MLSHFLFPSASRRASHLIIRAASTARAQHVRPAPPSRRARASSLEYSAQFAAGESSGSPPCAPAPSSLHPISGDADGASAGRGLGARVGAAVSGAADEDDVDFDVDEDGDASGGDSDGFSPHADSDAEDVDEWFGASGEANPLVDMTRNYYKRVLNPPASLVRGVEAVLTGRDTSALNVHWRAMAAAHRERTMRLWAAVKKAAKIAEAQKAGSDFLADIPPPTADSAPLLYGPTETLAFVLHRLFPAYGVATRSIDELRESLPKSWAPRNLLDFGSGPGTASLAAHAAWPDALVEFVLVEPSRSMAQVAEHLLADAPVRARARARLSLNFSLGS